MSPDTGPGFEIPEKDVSPYADSGRGIGIMRSIADELEYYRGQGKNTVVIRKYIEEGAWMICT
ncbi:MAG: ATP-binding protein [Desulfonatronovibrionaceae bacterium]